MAYGTVNADTLVTSTSGGVLGGGNASIMKNRIINGSCVIDQRNAGASSTPAATGGGTYTIDRFLFQASQASKFTVGQNLNSISPPVGFTKYLGFQVASSYSIGASDYFRLGQAIEGFNIADLGWGTANAKTVTLSFQVYSSLTGTFGGGIQSNGGGYSYPFSVTVTSANTWTPVTVTIVGPTTGTFPTDNTTGMTIWWSLGTGSTYSGTAGSWSGSNYFSATGATSVVGTNGATFYITGVQLEVGSSATGFEYRIYGTELANCQRYYNKILLGDTATSSTVGIMAFNYLSTLALGYLVYPVAMRTSASVITTGSTSNYSVLQNGGAVGLASVPVGTNVSNTITQINYPTAGGLNVGQGCALRGNTSSNNDWIALSAEL